MSALPGWWRWMAGTKIWRLSPSSGQVHFNRLTEAWPESDDSGWAPCEDDPATIGCLTARVREMWGEDAHVGVNHRDPSEWIVWARLGAAGWWSVVARGPTEWAALMAAGDAAWARRGGAA